MNIPVDQKSLDERISKDINIRCDYCGTEHTIEVKVFEDENGEIELSIDNLKNEHSFMIVG